MARPRPKPARIGATEQPDLGGADPGAAEAELLAEAELEGVELRDASLEGVRLRGVRLVDVAAEDLAAANGDWGEGLLRRVVLRGSRMTGLNLGAAKIEEARFAGCKLDYANFRHCTIEHATFEDCVLTGADFQGAEIYATRFSGCQLAQADFTKAELSHVDLRGSELAPAGSVLGLRGAIVDSLQLIDLSPVIAHELGIVVEDRPPG